MSRFRLTLLGGFRLDDADGREIFVVAAKALSEVRRIRPRLSTAEIRLWVGRALDSPAAALGL
jgi:hypothetical protein